MLIQILRWMTVRLLAHQSGAECQNRIRRSLIPHSDTTALRDVKTAVLLTLTPHMKREIKRFKGSKF